MYMQCPYRRVALILSTSTRRLGSRFSLPYFIERLAYEHPKMSKATLNPPQIMHVHFYSFFGRVRSLKTNQMGDHEKEKL